MAPPQAAAARASAPRPVRIAACSLPFDLPHALARQRHAPRDHLCAGWARPPADALSENGRRPGAPAGAQLGWPSAGPRARAPRSRAVDPTGGAGSAIEVAERASRRVAGAASNDTSVEPTHPAEEGRPLGARPHRPHHPHVLHRVLDDERPDPERRVGRESRPLRRIEAADRLDEAEAALLDQVLEASAPGPIDLKRDLHDQPEVRLDEPALEREGPGSSGTRDAIRVCSLGRQRARPLDSQAADGS